MSKGIVMEILSQHMVVLTQDGQFLKLRRSHRAYDLNLGDEIPLSEGTSRRWIPRLMNQWAAASIAAVIMSIFILWGGFSFLGTNQTIAAYVDVDINPSVEFAINDKQKVIEARGLNFEGISIIEKLDYKNKPLIEVLMSMMSQVDHQQYLTPYLQQGAGSIMISSTMVTEESSFDQEEMSAQLEQAVNRYMDDHHPDNANTFKVAKVTTTTEVREQALQQGVSSGKAALKQIAEDQGKPMEWKKFQDSSVHEIVEELGGLEAIGQLLNGKSNKKSQNGNQSSGEKDNKNIKNEDEGNKGNKNDSSDDEKETTETEKNNEKTEIEGGALGKLKDLLQDVKGQKKDKNQGGKNNQNKDINNSSNKDKGDDKNKVEERGKKETQVENIEDITEKTDRVPAIIGNIINNKLDGQKKEDQEQDIDKNHDKEKDKEPKSDRDNREKNEDQREDNDNNKKDQDDDKDIDKGKDKSKDKSKDSGKNKGLTEIKEKLDDVLQNLNG